MENLTTALELTIIGMSLVFGSIVFLWIVMVVLVRLTNFSGTKVVESGQPGTAPDPSYEIKRRAAIAAVSVAMSLANENEIHEFPLPATAIVSAWQAVMRANHLNKRGPMR